MGAAPIPPDEPARLEALARYRVLDTASEASFDDIAALAAETCGAPIALVTLVDREREWFKARVGIDLSEAPREHAFCAHAILESDLMVVPDAAADDRFRANPYVVGEPHVRFYAGAPLLTPDGHRIGSLCVLDRVPRRLDEKGARALRVLARQVMLELELRRAIHEVSRASAETFQLHRQVVESSTSGIVVYDRQLRYRLWNPTMERMTGKKEAEVLGKTYQDVFPGFRDPTVDRDLGRALAGESVTTPDIDFRRLGTGRAAWGSPRFSPLRDAAGSIVGVLVMVRDITERKLAEEALRGSMERVSDGFVALDAQWRYTYVNQKAGQMFGRRPEDLVGKHIWTEFPDGETQKFAEMYRLAMATQTPQFLEEYYPPWNRWFENRIYPSPDGLSIFFREITEAKKAELALRESEERFRELAESIHEVFWMRSGDLSRTLYVSPAYEEIWGRSRVPLYASPDAWGETLHPEDKDRVLLALRDKAATGGFDETYRILRPDGTSRWIRDRGFPVRSPSGVVTKVAGIAEDVTALKRAEDALRESQSRLAEALDQSRDRVVLLEEQAKSRQSLARLVGQAPPMQEIYRRIRLAAQSEVTVLLTGESGTGKELAARAIHTLSERAAKPFVAVNCAAIPETLLESELFGHVKGAFTGAVRDKIGLFEAAQGGTLFLDEIGDMAPALQLKILRALQEREIRRVGDDRVIQVHVRLVTATHRDLGALVAQGAVREDFYYRVRVFEIRMPPLRERVQDIPLLVSALIEDLSTSRPAKVRGVTVDALRALMDYRWPGNVRELRNALEHAFVTVTGDTIRRDDLPASIFEAASVTPPSERERILDALRRAKGNKTAAAKTLKMSRVTLWKRLKDLGVRPKDYGK